MSNDEQEHALLALCEWWHHVNHKTDRYNPELMEKSDIKRKKDFVKKFIEENSVCFANGFYDKNESRIGILRIREFRSFISREILASVFNAAQKKKKLMDKDIQKIAEQLKEMLKKLGIHPNFSANLNLENNKDYTYNDLYRLLRKQITIATKQRTTEPTLTQKASSNVSSETAELKQLDKGMMKQENVRLKQEIIALKKEITELKTNKNQGNQSDASNGTSNASTMVKNMAQNMDTARNNVLKRLETQISSAQEKLETLNNKIKEKEQSL